MVKQFENLTKNEVEILLKAPILLSVLAACAGNEVSNMQEAEAVKLAHLKTFTAVPELLSYYAEVENNFKIQFDATVKKYSPFDSAKIDSLKKEIGLTNDVIAKLNKDFAKILLNSLSGYANHVKRAEHNILEDFIFPIPLQGITD